MLKLISILSLNLILISSSHAIFGDKKDLFGKLKKGCEEALDKAGEAAQKGKESFDQARNKLSEVRTEDLKGISINAQQLNNIKGSLNNKLAQTKDVEEQLLEWFKEAGGTAEEFNAVFKQEFTKNLFGTIKRIWKFDGDSITEIKEAMIIPLLGNLKNIQTHKSNSVELARYIIRFLFFTVELEMKFTKMAIDVTSAPVLIGDMFFTLGPEVASGPAALANMVNDVFMSRMKTIVTNKDLTFKEKYQAIMNMEDLSEEIMKQLSDMFSWNNLGREVDEWIEANN